jgi:hypothetical protein
VRRTPILVAGLLAAVPVVFLLPSAAPAVAAAPVHDLTVGGTGVHSYPAFDPAVGRYAVTTTAATGGTLTVHATTSDAAGVVRVDGRVAPGGTATVTGLASGDEVAVWIEDSAGVEKHALVYLPAGFPTLAATGPATGLAPGVIGLTLSDIFSTGTRFVTTVDRNGVPTHVLPVPGDRGVFDLKDQPDGSITFSESTKSPGRTGEEVVVLDDHWKEQRRLQTVGLVNTDLHDSILLPDGSRFLMAYEPRSTDLTDSVIQRISPSGQVAWQWSSEGLEDESLQAKPATGRWDYAHMNSMQLVDHDDLLVSFRHFGAVFRIATVAHDGYAAGEVIWKLGGRDSTFTFPDDPEHGPCAQHAATMLANGDVMVFDNGSGLLAGNLCLEPADPDGPAIARPHTRVVEYSLDTVTHEAEVAWSYTPPVASGEMPWYAWFMGSARRLGNGDTLVGWSAETRALAQEVDANKNLLWQLSLADPKPAPPLISYRASLMQEKDADAPAVDQVSLADGASYAVGTAATVDFRCSDRGGSSLRTCAGDLRPGDRLDTSTPGPHTLHLTATDGAGNTTTVTRSYTVTAKYQPRVGDDRVRAKLRGKRVSTQVTFTNAGTYADRFVLTGARGNKALAVHYKLGGADVTKAVLRGLSTVTLKPGESVVLRMVVARTDATRPGSHRTFAIRASSVADPSRTAEAKVKVRATG